MQFDSVWRQVPRCVASPSIRDGASDEAAECRRLRQGSTRQTKETAPLERAGLESADGAGRDQRPEQAAAWLINRQPGGVSRTAAPPASRDLEATDPHRPARLLKRAGPNCNASGRGLFRFLKSFRDDPLISDRNGTASRTGARGGMRAYQL